MQLHFYEYTATCPTSFEAPTGASDSQNICAWSEETQPMQGNLRAAFLSVRNSVRTGLVVVGVLVLVLVYW